MWASLRQFDAYVKLHKDVKVKTWTGGAVSMAAILAIGALILSELNIYSSSQRVDHLSLEQTQGLLRIDFDFTFHRLPCDLVSLDAIDEGGGSQMDIDHHITKVPLNSRGGVMGAKEVVGIGGTMKEEEMTTEEHGEAEDAEQEHAEEGGGEGEGEGEGEKCGSCYGAEENESQCCNTCEEVRKAYQRRGWALKVLEDVEQCVRSGQTNTAFAKELEEGQGCRIAGYIEVKKLNGHFHFAPGRSFQHSHMHVHDLAAFSAGAFNVSHRINSLRFGRAFEGAVNVLDGTVERIANASGRFMYYTKVVPTTFQPLHGKAIQTAQYSATQHWRPLSTDRGHALPGVFIFYELSPLHLTLAEESPSFSHLLTRVCAILGGVLTVAGIVDRLVFHGLKQLEKKLQMGKIL